MLDSYAPVNYKYYQGVNLFYQIARKKRERERDSLLTIYIIFCFEGGRRVG